MLTYADLSIRHLSIRHLIRYFGLPSDALELLDLALQLEDRSEKYV